MGSPPAPNNADLDWFFQFTNDVLDAIDVVDGIDSDSQIVTKI